MRYGNCMDGNCIDGNLGHGISQGMNYIGFGSHWLFGVIVIIVIALLFIAFVHNKKMKSFSFSEAEEALKMRYVNGEISEEEYQKMKKMIH